MELDDLKKPWQEATQNIKLSNTNIRDIIFNKSTGPAEKLKQAFKKRLIILPFVLLLLVNNTYKHHDILNDGLFWLYVCIWLILMGYFYYSYKVANRMQAADNMVKANLEKQVLTLEKLVTKRLLFVRVVLIVFFVCMELLMYFQQEPALVKWYARPFMLRLATYVGGVIFFYFFSGFFINKKYNALIQKLKELVNQMQ